MATEHMATAKRRKVGPRRHTSNLVQSPAWRKSMESRRKGRIPVVVTGVSPAKRITVTPQLYKRLDVDPSYQRGKTSEVNSIVSAIQNGGLIPDPVTLVQRPWSNDPERLWIIDGHQRATAFQMLGASFDALVHESDSIEAERRLFLAMNSKIPVSSNIAVKAWDGPGAVMLRAVNNDPGHPLYQRVNMESSRNDSRIEAAIVIKGMIGATTGTLAFGDIQVALRRLDTSLTSETGAKERARVFLRLLAAVAPKGKISLLPSVVIGTAAYQRWKDHVPEVPPPSVTGRLARINWRAEIPTFAMKFRPVLVAIVDRIWR